MAVKILRGPAGGGKSQYFEVNREPDDLWLDMTSLWAAVKGIERDPETGLYPVRLDDDPGLRVAAYLKSTAIAFAAREGLKGFTTTSNSSPEAVERLIELGADGGVEDVGVGFTEDELHARLIDRLARKDKQLAKQCERAIGRWYKRNRGGRRRR